MNVLIKEAERLVALAKLEERVMEHSEHVRDITARFKTDPSLKEEVFLAAEKTFDLMAEWREINRR